VDADRYAAIFADLVNDQVNPFLVSRGDSGRIVAARARRARDTVALAIRDSALCAVLVLGIQAPLKVTAA
jgi:hypothetical protein